MKKLTGLLILVILFSYGCHRRSGDGDGDLSGTALHWEALDSVNAKLPPGIRVYHSIHNTRNLRAWYVQVAEPRPEIQTRVVVSEDEDKRQTITEFAEQLQAPVLINGGYFRRDLTPARHVGILKVDGKLIHSATASVLKSGQRFFLHRSAISIDDSDHVQISWVSSSGDSVFAWDWPINNQPDVPGPALDTTFRKYLPAGDVLGAGPCLIRDGKIHITVNEEVFFDSSIPDVHPRTAVGITENQDLILLVVDGRQLVSRGVDLVELSEILYDLGCVQAMNLDGGGSSALVVNGQLLNRPAGKTDEREVMSALAVFVQPDTTLP